jgi:WhiB family redox-sensing transcriptional regulator
VNTGCVLETDLALAEPVLDVLCGGLDPLSRHCPEDLPCRVQNGDLWFAESPADLEQAKAFCRACPARHACLAGAIERHEPWGVWGGEIFERGAVVARKRPRGRPRKDDRREVAA